MTREQRLELLKQIEKDIHVCSLESTLLDDAKSCAIHSVIEELEQASRTDDDDLISKEKVIQILRVYSRCGLVTPRIIAEMEHDIKLIK